MKLQEINTITDIDFEDVGRKPEIYRIVTAIQIDEIAKWSEEDVIRIYRDIIFEL